MFLRKIFNATESSQKIVLPRGTYLFDCWGASGGDINSIKGSSGAFVSGKISISEKKTFYIYVGKKGNNEISRSFNGGGRGSSYGASGGGATDIRLVDDQDLSGLKSRIIVASGGGGANKHFDGCSGGSGGIIRGEDGFKSYNRDVIVVPTAGTQKSGGKKGYTLDNNVDYNGTDGSFGQGGDAADNKNHGSGGGGGYFGGGGGSDGPGVTSCGAGGSSFISGYSGCFAVNELMTDISNPMMLDSSIHYSGLVFRNIMVIPGSDLKRDDDGRVVITFLYSSKCSFVRCNRHELRLIAASIFVIVK